MNWDTKGNAGTNPPSNFLGTTDNKALVLKTQGKERLRIDPQGKVGIGKKPGSRLDIVGDAGKAGTMLLVPDSSKGNNPSHIHWDTTGDWFIRSASPSGHVVIQDLGGNVGVGTAQPEAKLQVTSDGKVPEIALLKTAKDFARLRFLLGFVTDAGNARRRVFWDIMANGDEWSLANNLYQAVPTKVFTATTDGNIGVGTDQPGEKLEVNGRIKTGDLIATGDVNVLGDVYLKNADVAEEFFVNEDNIEPGTVMVLDDHGGLRQSREAYDRRVAGVVSGAGDFRPAITLDRHQKPESGRLPLALVGKVFCKVDTQYSPIAVGDLLTTSPTSGHAMKATDSRRAFGSIIGKALRSLHSGQGLLPILVALQ